MRIIFLFGEICSGKSYIMQKSLVNKDYGGIKVSDYVRKFSAKENSRFAMQETQMCDLEVAKEIVQDMKKQSFSTYIIDGIRQLTIYHVIAQAFPEATSLVYWVTVDCNTQALRFSQRANIKDRDCSLLEYKERDDKLGLKECKDYFIKNNLIVATITSDQVL